MSFSTKNLIAVLIVCAILSPFVVSDYKNILNLNTVPSVTSPEENGSTVLTEEDTRENNKSFFAGMTNKLNSDISEYTTVNVENVVKGKACSALYDTLKAERELLCYYLADYNDDGFPELITVRKFQKDEHHSFSGDLDYAAALYVTVSVYCWINSDRDIEYFIQDEDLINPVFYLGTKQLYSENAGDTTCETVLFAKHGSDDDPAKMEISEARYHVFRAVNSQDEFDNSNPKELTPYTDVSAFETYFYQQ